MASAKKRKVNEACLFYQEKWTNKKKVDVEFKRKVDAIFPREMDTWLFCAEVKGKFVCLVCGAVLAVMENLKKKKPGMFIHSSPE